jgi:hypothetical protein
MSRYVVFSIHALVHLTMVIFSHQCERSRKAHSALWKRKRCSDRIELKVLQPYWHGGASEIEIDCRKYVFLDTFSLSYVDSICVSTVKWSQFISMF